MTELRKPFDIELLNQGWQVETRNGCPVRIGFTDAKNGRGYLLQGLIDDGECETSAAWTLKGEYLESGMTNDFDLVMRPIFICQNRAVYPGDTLYCPDGTSHEFNVTAYKLAQPVIDWSWQKPEEKPRNVWEDVRFANGIGRQHTVTIDKIIADKEVLDAYSVIAELRQCEGAMQVNEDDRGFIARFDREEDCIGFCNLGSSSFLYGHLAPFFPTRELYEAALDKVGRARVITAIKVLDGVA